mmetsp:Transcript_3730/g.11777  ORF Transcript_3730/g.11777 Transcript_3730/m.11777 type:complete len:219 (+) Transcript_3730:634-1290(+)
MIASTLLRPAPRRTASLSSGGSSSGTWRCGGQSRSWSCIAASPGCRSSISASRRSSSRRPSSAPRLLSSTGRSSRSSRRPLSKPLPRSLRGTFGRQAWRPSTRATRSSCSCCPTAPSGTSRSSACHRSCGSWGPQAARPFRETSPYTLPHSACRGLSRPTANRGRSRRRSLLYGLQPRPCSLMLSTRTCCGLRMTRSPRPCVLCMSAWCGTRSSAMRS